MLSAVTDRLCPRGCGVLIERATPPHEGAWHCGACDGQFACARDLERVHPILARIQIEREQALASPRHGTGAGACASCGRPMVPLSFFEVPIDWCADCGGVWLDGGELATLGERVRATLGDVRAAELNPYRGSARSSLTLGTVTCGACGAQVRVDESMLSADGPRCMTCGLRAAGSMPSDEAAAEIDAFLDGTEAKHTAEGWRTFRDKLGPHPGAVRVLLAWVSYWCK